MRATKAMQKTGDSRLGNRMRDLRKLHNQQKQDTVAKEMCLHPDKLRDFERGKRLPRLDELQKFCMAVRLTPGEREEVAALYHYIILERLVGMTTPPTQVAATVALSHIKEDQHGRDIQLSIDTDSIWRPILENGAVIALSNPPVYRYANLNDPLELQNTIPQGNEKLILSLDEYTGIGETSAIIKIIDMFHSVSKREMLVVMQSRESISINYRRNLILLGGWKSNIRSEEVLKATEPFFKAIPFQHYEGGIHLIYPGTENSVEPYYATFNSYGEIIYDYGLITKVGNPYNRNNSIILILAGTHSQGTEAAAEFVTNPKYLRELHDKLGHPFPQYFQVLFGVTIKDGYPQTPEYIDHQVISEIVAVS